MNDDLLRRIERGITSTDDYCFGCKHLQSSHNPMNTFGVWHCKKVKHPWIGMIGDQGFRLICDGPWRLCDGEWEYHD